MSVVHGPLVLGTMMFGNWGNTDEVECHRMVHRALDAGITCGGWGSSASPIPDAPARPDVLGCADRRGGVVRSRRGQDRSGDRAVAV